jgi:hypothetical protein
MISIFIFGNIYLAHVASSGILAAAMFGAISVLLKYMAQLLTGGGLMAALWLIDHFTSKKFPKRVYVWILVGCIIWAALASYRDEHHNAQLLTEQKKEAWGKFNQCDKERAVGQEAVNLLTSQLEQRDGMLSNQQDTFNKCILAVGVKNTPEPQKLDVQWTSIGAARDGKQTVLFLAQTNKPLASVRHKFTCPFQFHFISFGLSQKDPQTLLLESGQDSDKEASFSMTRDWQPGSVLVVAVSISQNDLSRVKGCTITPKQ